LGRLTSPWCDTVVLVRFGTLTLIKSAPPAAKPQEVIGPLTYIYMRIYVYTYIPTYIHTYVHICIHTKINIHTQIYHIRGA